MNMIAYVEGKEAYKRGLDLIDNPYRYDAGSEKWSEWRKGWLHMGARD